MHVLIFFIVCLFYTFNVYSEVNIIPSTGTLGISVKISSICQYPVSISYNPQITKSSTGVGWQSSLDTELQISKEIDFYTVNAYCSKFLFNRNNDGTFSSGGSDRAALIFSNNNYILTANNGEKLTFDPEGTLKSIQNVSGQTAEISRDTNNRISSWSIKSDKVESFSADDILSGSGGKTLSSGNGVIRWNDNATISELSADNKNFSFVYDKNNRLIKIGINSKDTLASFDYDSSGKLISMIEPDHQYSFTYYDDGRIQTIDDQLGDDLYVEYEIVDGLNHCIVWNLTKFTETEYVLDKGKILVTQSPIDSEVELSAVINLATGERTITNHLKQNTYVIKGDTKGNLRIDSNLLGFTPLISTFDFLNSVTQNINGFECFREITVPSEFEAAESRSTIKNNGIMKDYVGNIIQVINKNFNAVNFYYDNNNRLSKVVTSAGGEYLYEYTEDGKIKKVTDPFNHVQEYTYLPDNKVIASLPNNESISISYDEWGFPTEIKEPQNRETVVTYSNRGEIETVELKELDSQSFLSSLEDGLISLQSNLYGNWLFRDTFDGTLTRISPNGDIVFFNLLKKQLISVSDSEEKTLENYSYNNNGQLKVVSAPQVSISYKYDDKGRLIEKKYDKENFGINFSYNKKDLMNAVSDTRGFKTEYITDIVGRLTEVKNKEAGNFKIEYSNNGLIKSIYYPNGLIIKKIYDKADRLLEYSSLYENKELEKSIMEYDSLGNVISVSNGDGKREKYYYDSLCHITKAEYKDGRKDSFVFDKWGTFENKDVLLSIDNQARIEAAKLQTSGLKFSYGYNNLLSKIESNGKSALEIYYNPVDSLPAMILNSNGNKTNYIFIDNNLYAVIKEKEKITRYIYIPGTNICLALITANGTILYPLSDYSDTIEALYDKNGKLVAKRDFDVLGRIIGEDNLDIDTGFQGNLSFLNNRIVMNEKGLYLIDAQRLLSKIAPVPGNFALDFTNRLSYLDGNTKKNINLQKNKNNNLELLDE